MTHAPTASPPLGSAAYAPPSATAATVPTGRLALAFQEILTATVRLRSGRQVAADADSFRQHAKQVLAAAEQEARTAGYGGADVRLAIFAAVAFLDESVLNCGQPMFAEWPRKPLQDELFGGHLGGEMFFQYLQQLLERDESPELADLLEVFHLCLLLGFQGRYSMGGAAELQLFAQRAGDKIARIRGPLGELSPEWRPPAGEVASVGGDPWVRRLAIGAGIAALLVVVLFVVYRLSLGAGADELRQLAATALR